MDNNTEDKELAGATNSVLGLEKATLFGLPHVDLPGDVHEVSVSAIQQLKNDRAAVLERLALFSINSTDVLGSSCEHAYLKGVLSAIESYLVLFKAVEND